MKASGIDLLDLLKEGLLKPATVVNLTGVPGLDAIVEDEGRRLAHRTDGHAGIALRSSVLLRNATRPWPTRLRGSASPQIRNVATLGGNLLQRPRCWYFRSHAFRCLRKGGGHCFAHQRRKPIPRDFRQYGLRHRSSFDRRHGAGGVGRDYRAHQWRGRHASLPASRISSCRPTATFSARTT